MPMVPFANDGTSVRQGGDLNVNATPNSFGAPQAQAMGQMGQSLDRASDSLAQVSNQHQQLQNEIDANNADNDVAEKVRKLQFGDPEDASAPPGFATLRGGQVTPDVLKQYSDRIAQVRDQAVADAANPRLSAMIANMARKRTDYTLSSLAQHADQQQKSYADQTAASSIQNSAQDAILHSENPAYVDGQLADIQARTQARGQMAGWDAATVKAEADKASTPVFTGILERAYSTGGLSAAEAARQQYAGRMSGAAAEAADRMLKPLRDNAQAQTDAYGALGMAPPAALRSPAVSALPHPGAGGADGGLAQLLSGLQSGNVQGKPGDLDMTAVSAVLDKANGGKAPAAAPGAEDARFQQMVSKLAPGRGAPASAPVPAAAPASGQAGTVPLVQPPDLDTSGQSAAPFAVSPAGSPRTKLDFDNAKADIVTRLSAEPDRMHKALDQLSTMEAVSTHQQQEQERANRDIVLNAAMGDVGSQSKPTSEADLLADPKVRAALVAAKPETREAAMRLLEHNAAGRDPPQTQDATSRYYTLMGEATQNPDQFRQEKLDDPELVKLLPRHMLQGLMSEQFRLGTQDAKNATKQQNLSSALSTVRPFVVAAGVPTNADPGSPNSQAYAQFVGEYSAGIDKFQTDNKRLPNPKEMHDIAGPILERIPVQDPVMRDANLSRVHSMAAEPARAAGLFTNAAPGTGTARRYDSFLQQLDTSVDQFRQLNRRNPSQPEALALARTLLAPGNERGGGMLWGDSGRKLRFEVADPSKFIPAGWAPASAPASPAGSPALPPLPAAAPPIPDADRTGIANAFQQRTGRAPSDAELSGIYSRLASKRAVPPSPAGSP